VDILEPGRIVNPEYIETSPLKEYFGFTSIPTSLSSLYPFEFMVSSSNTTGKINAFSFSPDSYTSIPYDEWGLSSYADDNAWGSGAGGMVYAVIPMTAINIPEDAVGVRVEVGWDLTDVIERREGKTAADDDDIFVLKNNFWDGLSVKIVAE
jgi:hypothetical protein